MALIVVTNASVDAECFKVGNADCACLSAMQLPIKTIASVVCQRCANKSNIQLAVPLVPLCKQFAHNRRFELRANKTYDKRDQNYGNGQRHFTKEE